MADISKDRWAWPGAARKAHFFEAGHIISLCRKWMFTGEATPNQGGPSPDDCADCTRRLKKRDASG